MDSRPRCIELLDKFLNKAIMVLDWKTFALQFIV